MYRGFKQECPSGIVNEQMFKEIYSQFFPQGGKNLAFLIWSVEFFFDFQSCFLDCSNYAHYVFSTIDQNSNGTVNFEVNSINFDFVKCISRLIIFQQKKN